MAKIKPEYSLIPDEKKPQLPHQTDLEKTLSMRISYLKGCMHAVLNEANEYMEWATNRRKHNKKMRSWRWKVTFMKMFYSHFERRIQEIEWRLERINYKSGPS